MLGSRPEITMIITYYFNNLYIANLPICIFIIATSQSILGIVMHFAYSNLKYVILAITY